MNAVYMPGLPNMPSLLATLPGGDAAPPQSIFSIDNQWLISGGHICDPVTPRGPTTSSRPQSAIDARFYDEVIVYSSWYEVFTPGICVEIIIKCSHLNVVNVHNHSSRTGIMALRMG